MHIIPGNNSQLLPHPVVEKMTFLVLNRWNVLFPGVYTQYVSFTQRNISTNPNMQPSEGALS